MFIVLTAPPPEAYLLKKAAVHVKNEYEIDRQLVLLDTPSFNTRIKVENS